MAEVTPPPEYLKWGSLIERMIITTFYRVMSFTSLHAPIGEIYKACEYMSRNTPYGGKVYYLIPERVFNWDNVIVNRNPDYPVTMNMRVFGSPIRNKNTVFARIGWWKFYITDAVLMLIGTPFRRG
ncbi:MAG: hypothetical protein QXR44_03175 [Thermoproteota archaeon]